MNETFLEHLEKDNSEAEIMYCSTGNELYLLGILEDNQYLIDSSNYGTATRKIKQKISNYIGELRVGSDFY